MKGFVPPLELLTVRQISPRFLSQDERIEFADLVRAGVSVRGIARRLGRAPSTILRELRRNAARGHRPGYRPFEAHRQATVRRARPRPRRLDSHAGLRREVVELLGQRWSPQQISRHLRRRFPDERSMWLCHESIYLAPYQPGSTLLRPSGLAPHRRSPLRSGRDHRRAHEQVDRRRPRFEQPVLSIHERPFNPADRSQAGHWEGGLIIGKGQGSAIGTLQERQTRLVRLLHLPLRDSRSLHAALLARLGDLPAQLLRSITWDQGTEMAGHRTITRIARRSRVLLRLPLTVAARLQREHERTAARLLPQGHRPKPPQAETPPGRRERAQPPATDRAERPHSRRAVPDAASLTNTVRVATSTRTRPVKTGLLFDRR